MAKQLDNGKAFEYACLEALYRALKEYGEVSIEPSAPLETAKGKYLDLPKDTQNNLTDAANAATRVISRLEPQLKYEDNSAPLVLAIQSDAHGIAGDVRDVVCIRRKNKWEIGLSCKHNHHAVKHSRLSRTIDFGSEWIGTPCSKQYFLEINQLFDELQRIKDNAAREGRKALWSEIQNKSERFYKPLLQSFMDELNRLSIADKDAPSKLIQYLIGRYDFYKVITDDRHRTTRVEAVNLAGTLNRPVKNHKSIVDIPKLRFPSKFYHIGFKDNSDNTIEVVCDEGWTISMRIHNASSKVETSLKFDVTLISLPSSIYAQVEPW